MQGSINCPRPSVLHTCATNLPHTNDNASCEEVADPIEILTPLPDTDLQVRAFTSYLSDTFAYGIWTESKQIVQIEAPFMDAM